MAASSQSVIALELQRELVWENHAKVSRHSGRKQSVNPETPGERWASFEV